MTELAQALALLAAVLVSGLMVGLWLIFIGSSISSTRVRIVLLSVLSFGILWYVAGR